MQVRSLSVPLPYVFIKNKKTILHYLQNLTILTSSITMVANDLCIINSF